MADLATAEVGEETILPDPAPPKKHRSPLATALLTALLVGPLAVGGFVVYSQLQARQKAALEKWQSHPPVVESVCYTLDTQTVNLADGDRYARVKLALAFELDPIDAAYFRTTVATLTGDDAEQPPPPPSDGPKPPKKEAGKEVQQLVYTLYTQQEKINDIMIGEIGARRYEALLQPADKEALKKVLAERIDEVLTPSKSKVHDIYFSEFVMQ